MAPMPAPVLLSNLSSAFAAACQSARSEAELFERCRAILVERLQSEQIWISITSPNASFPRVGPVHGFDHAKEVARLSSGATVVVVSAEESLVAQLRAVAMPLVLALSVVTELRGILVERQAALDDAAFQLRALRQVARLLSSVHSTEETEQLILDFMAEVFFAWWACLYRPEDGRFVPRVFRALNDRRRPTPVDIGRRRHGGAQPGAPDRGGRQGEALRRQRRGAATPGRDRRRLPSA